MKAHLILTEGGKVVSLILSPVIRFLRLARIIEAMSEYLSFLIGMGAGSGWDSSGESRVVTRYVSRPEAVIFDVGANDGRWSRAVAESLESQTTKYFLFECSPYVLPHMGKNLPYIPNSTVVESAVSESVGTVELFTPTRGSGLASLSERNDVGVRRMEYEQVQVPSVTIDSVLEEYSIEEVDYLKMDIEGHELHALRGAENALARGALKVIQFEFGSANVNSRVFFREIYSLLAAHDYALLRIGPGGTTFPVRAYHEGLEFYRGATNYVAVLGKA